MKRLTLFGLGLTGAALVAFPASVFAADFPPPPPTLYYGKANGAVAGQGVIAIVSDGTTSTVCGDGVVLNDSSAGIVYAVDVIADGQQAGCGKSGRTVSFYFTPIGGSGGKLANGSVSWRDASASPTANDLTLGSALTPRASVPEASRDGTY